MTMGERICIQRTAHNLSQSDLAERLGVSRQSVSKWETDASVPDLDKLVKMCDVFEVTLDQLVRGKEGDSSAAAEAHAAPQTSVQWDTAAKSGMTVRITVGLMLLFLGVLVFLLWVLFRGAPLNGLILASPFLLCGTVCLLCKRHPALVCGWIVWGLVTAYLRYGTGIRFWWVFYPWIYRQEMLFHAITAWGEALTFSALLSRSLWLVWRRYSTLTK